tara:strand:+ start:301 stop:534 length:234 start_codon:yes stop_codon:yes gene_type:complete
MFQAAIVLPERMHWAHTRVFLRFPPGFRILTVCKFGIQRLFVLLLAWLTRFPLAGVFPQISHFDDILIFGLLFKQYF